MNKQDQRAEASAEGRSAFQDPWLQVAAVGLWGFALADALAKDAAWWFRVPVIVWGVLIVWNLIGVVRIRLGRRGH